MEPAQRQQYPLAISPQFGAPEGQDARLLAERSRGLAKDRRVLVHIAVDDVRLWALADLLAFFAPDVQVAIFPAWDCLPYDRVSPHGDVVARRIDALTTLMEWEEGGLYKPRILLTTVNAATQRVLPKNVLKTASLSVRKGGKVDEVRLRGFLVDNGYLRTETVREAGEFAIRGNIFDLFPPGYDEPIRIDLFGDEVETIRSFDPSTQRSTGFLDVFSLRPVTEFFLTEDSIQKFRAGYRDLFGVVTQGNPLYEAVSEGRRHAGMEHWQPLFFGEMDTLFSYLNHPALSLDHQAEQARDERDAQILDFYQARKTLDDSLLARKKKKDGGDVSLSGTAYHPLPPQMLYLGAEEFYAAIEGADPLELHPFGGPAGEEEAARKARDFGDVRSQPNLNLFHEVASYFSALKRKSLIACYSIGSAERLKLMFEEHGEKGAFIVCKNLAEVSKLKSGQVGLAVLSLEHGFVAPDLVVLTEQDILGDRLTRKSGKRRKADNFLREVSSLSPGDLVVHVDHGVGRFEGLETLKAAGTLHDCLKIVYAGGDKLFVPVENMEVLSRFGSEEAGTDLDKLGGAGWQARKARVKKDLMRMAEGLLKIAAERHLRTADRLEISSGDLNDFIARFPYQETEDQLRAIADTLEDMGSGNAMDRLICGDVGFGKTEVALRAAYVAAMSGVQVAVIAPTTLLARQHAKIFAERFKGLGLRTAQLSRLVSAKEAQIAKDELAAGTVRIVIGTHAILGSGIKFANLGLVIVDEEQRFGVKQKEKLKELKANVHVLTLTATPIPRTLQMALSGVRDMSIIATPPVDRLAIRTFVMPFDPVVIREAILREHYRGGQTFYVCPRISDIADLETLLKDLVPEVKVIAAHGQMTPTELEDRMTAFYEGQYGILLATNIIESGLDIPAANTIIVHRADMFGLSQLYQIRGRVGRSKVRAYAYLTYDSGMKLTEQSQKRLEVFETLDSLGAGFQLASHDLDIRGAGNLLGDAQSGHIREVGIELYQQMLEDAVAEARMGAGQGSAVKDSEWTPTINIGMSVLIPEKYVEDLSLRMSLYRRLTDLETEEDIESFAAELIDRFGELPDEVSNLLDIVKIKLLCRRAGVEQVDAGPKGAIVAFRGAAPPNPEKLLAWMMERPGSVKLRPDQKLGVIRAWETPRERVRGVSSLMGDLAKLAAE
jgi:transcription-repair coupling factor (superfamily II helicase)